MRIVSVLPSATEIVASLGHGSELVGRSAECDFPPEVRELPVVMRPRTLDAERPSADIDARVRAARGRGESLYSLDVPLIARLEPDLILTQDLCGVCSVTDAEVREACARAGVTPDIVSLAPRTLTEVWTSIETAGVAVGDPAAGVALADRLRRRAAPAVGPEARPRVLVVEWLAPPIFAGLWVPEMIEASGGTPIGPREGDPGERGTWEGVARLQPDLVLLAPCSFPVDRTERELRAPSLREAVGRLAPPQGIYLADEAYFSRPGPRLADGVDLLRNLLSGRPWASPMPVVSLPTVHREAAA